MAPLTLVHVFPTFAPGGAQARTIQLMNALGGDFRHRVAACDGITTARKAVAPHVDFDTLQAPPPAGSFDRARAFRHALRAWKPDLLLTYNWGAIDAAMAACLTPGLPFIHGEDGFGADEAVRLKPRRVWTRALVLRGARGVVVPSRVLERIALDQYRLPRAKVLYIPNGVDTNRFTPRPDNSLRQTLGIPTEAPVIGSVGQLRAEKNFELLIRAFARLEQKDTRLLLVGQGDQRSALEAAARDCGCAARIHFAGQMTDTVPAYAAMDVFALSSHTEQMPVSLLEAMASGRPAVCTNVGDCAAMLDTSERPWIVPKGDDQALAAALRQLLENPDLRREAGARFRLRAESVFSQDGMVEQYRALYTRYARR